MAAVVPRLYQVLNAVDEPAELARVLEVLWEGPRAPSLGDKA